MTDHGGAPGSVSPRRRRQIVGLLCIPVFVVGLDVTVLNVAIPTLARSLSASTQQLQWIVDAYLLTSAGLMLSMGSLADRMGRKRVLIGGFWLFIAGSVMAAFSHGTVGLIAGRAVMGTGGACIIPPALSIITACSPDQRSRAGAMSAWATVNGAGIALGPVVGGLLLAHFWWGSVFLVNIPIVLVALVAVIFFVPEARERRRTPLDPVGAVLSIVGLGLLLFAVIEAPLWSWASTRTLGALAGSTVVLGGFVVWEYRGRQPMIDRWFAGRRAFWVQCVTLALVYFALFGALFLVTQYLQSVDGMSPMLAGVAFLPVAVAIALGAAPAPWLGRKMAPRAAIVMALGLLIVGWLAGAATNLHSGYSTILALMVVGGIGYGITGTLCESTVMGALPNERLAVGAATNTTALQVAGAIGIAVMGSLAATVYRSRLSTVVLGHIPITARDVARGSVGAAVAEAHRLPGPAGSALAAAARSSFIAGYGPALLAGAAALAGAAILVRALFPAAAETDADVLSPGAVVVKRSSAVAH